MKPHVPEHEILETLAEIGASLCCPAWLSGGVAVAFLVGRFTRPHADIDLVARNEDRAALLSMLQGLGYHGNGAGWNVQLRRAGGAPLDITFFQRGPDGRDVLVIRPEDGVGVPGHYPALDGYLDPDRFATLGGVRFRVCSAEGEYWARVSAHTLVAGRTAEPKIEHDRRLLEALLPLEPPLSPSGK